MLRKYYIVKDDSDIFVALFTNLEDCLEFIEPPLHYDEIRI